MNKRLSELTMDDYKAFVRFWCDGTIVKSGRTGVNYIRAFKRMIETLKVPTPDGFAELFSFRVTDPPKIARYDAEVLKIFLRHTNERVRLFSLMCLNFGYYQVDIARLRLDQITDAEGGPYRAGDMYITKRRERTRHQNAFATTVYVWPETQRLMEQFRAKPNPAGTYFLTKLGLPYKVKTVSGIVEETIRTNKLNGDMSLKQFRKIGASQLKALAGSDAMHQYKANALSAADKPYILEDYSILTNALRKLREKLLTDGCLPPV